MIVMLERTISNGIWKLICPGDTKYKGADIGTAIEGSWMRTCVPLSPVGNGIEPAELIAAARFDPNNEARLPGLRCGPNEAPFRTPVTFGDVCADTTNAVRNHKMRRRMIHCSDFRSTLSENQPRHTFANGIQNYAGRLFSATGRHRRGRSERKDDL